MASNPYSTLQTSMDKTNLILKDIEQAIELNGAAVEMSRNAFRFGRLAARDPAALSRLIGSAMAEKKAVGQRS